MSALIKAGTGTGDAGVRCFAMPRPDLLTAVAIPSEHDTRIAALEEEVATLRAALAEAAGIGAKAEEKAHEEGFTAGTAAARRDEDARLKAIAAGAAAAAADWSEKLDALDGLAAALAQAALGRLFADAPDWREMVCRNLARQLQDLRRDAVVAVRVSAADFPDAASLAEAGGRLQLGTVAISADPALEAGSCRLDLRLGHVDLSLPRQWAVLADILAEPSR